MKMTKKILLGAAALVVAMAFVGCAGGEKASDDPNNMIEGKNSNYTIDFVNETGAESRGYKATKLKHAGGLVKITIDAGSSSNSSNKMGFIFDLKANADDSSAKDFFIIAFGNDNKYYVSKFSNVTDQQAYNFGTELTDNPADEKCYTDPVNCNPKVFDDGKTLSEDEDGNKYAYIYAFGNADGSFDWKILNASATEKVKSLSDKEFKNLDFTEDMILAEGTIPAEDTGYTKQTQNLLAVYAKVNKDQTLVGAWDFVGTYKEAEVIE